MDEIRLMVLGGASLPAVLSRGDLGAAVRVLTSGDTRRVAEAFESGEVDVAAVDVDGQWAVRAIREICSASDRARVLAITDDDSLGAVIGGLAAGACGVASKRASKSEIVRSLRRVAAGELVIPDRHRPTHTYSRPASRGPRSTRAASHAGAEAAPARPGHPGGLESLTAREMQVLRSLAGGLPTAEIAADLGIRPMTVLSHVKSILVKLGVHSKLEAVTLAWRSGMAVAETA